jgi:hypothetical protein
MDNLLPFFESNLLVIILISIAIAVLIVLLWRNYDIDEITPTPPFVKFKRKVKRTDNSPHPSINITGNTMWGKNKMGIRRQNTNVSDNTMIGENEMEVGSKPGPKPKRGPHSQ